MNSNENTTASQIEELLREAESEKIPIYKAAVEATPKQYLPWLFGVLQNDHKHKTDLSFSDFLCRVPKVGFSTAVLEIVELALDPDGKELRRGYSWHAGNELEMLKDSINADFGLLLEEALKPEANSQSDHSEDSGINWRIQHYKGAAVRHLPALVDDKQTVVRVLSSALEHNDPRVRNWAAVYLSFWNVDDISLSKLILNSIFKHWKSSTTLEYMFGHSGEITSVIALLTLASRRQSDKLRQKKILDQCRKLALSSEPANKPVAEAAVRKLYRATGLDVPPIVWRTPMVPVSEYCGQLFDENREKLAISDVYHERYIDSCVRVQRIAVAAEVALKWYTNGYWQYVSDSEGDIWHAGLSGLGSDPCFWPPDGIAETTDRTWFIPEWLESMHELSLLGDPVHERLRYSFGPSSTDLLPPLLTQGSVNNFVSKTYS